MFNLWSLKNKTAECQFVPRGTACPEALCVTSYSLP